MKFGEKLILLRKRHGMSQAELAEELGVSRQTISKWEIETTAPSTKNLSNIGKLFGVPVDALVNENVQIQDGPVAVIPAEGEPNDNGGKSGDRQTAFRTIWRGVICAVCILAVAVTACVGIYLFTGRERNIIPIEEMQVDEIELLPDVEILLNPIISENQQKGDESDAD